MIFSVSESGNRINAKDVTKKDAPFFCPMCNGDLNVKKGRVRIHHFAHQKFESCFHGVGETELHRETKIDIYRTIKSSKYVKECVLEKKINNIIPDVFALIRNTPVGIEVQASSLSMDQIINRSAKYIQNKTYLLWILPYNPGVYKDKYSPKIYEKWIHAVYFGRVYYWWGEGRVLPVHYNSYYLWRSEYDTWDHHIPGGYYLSKRYKTPDRASLIEIVKDFKPVIRKQWNSGKIYVPTLSIYNERRKKWWKDKVNPELEFQW